MTWRLGSGMYRVRHKSVNTLLRHKSVNTPLSHELRARCVQQAVRGIKGVNRLMPHPVERLCGLGVPYRVKGTEVRIEIRFRNILLKRPVARPRTRWT